jgi:hypothetical protein
VEERVNEEQRRAAQRQFVGKDHVLQVDEGQGDEDAEEDGGGRKPAPFQEYEQTAEARQAGEEGEHLVGGELLQQAGSDKASDQEKNNLYGLLAKSLDKKLLNSKTSVIYDQEKESITEIKGLVMHRNSEGTVLFQLLDKQKAVTFRKKKTTQEEQTT